MRQEGRQNPPSGPMIGLVNGVLGSLAMWAVIAGVVVAVAA